MDRGWRPGRHRRRDRVHGGEFRVGFMEDLPWPDDTFDAVTGFNAFQYTLDVDFALSEARRVARPRGWIAICKWARPEDNEFFAFLIALGAGSPTGSDPMDDAVRRAQRGRRVRRRAGTDGNGG